MCRLLGYVARAPRSPRDMLGDAYGSFEDFSCGLHGDGWGAAWCEGATLRTAKEAIPAHESATYRALSDRPFDAALVHYRWATLALEVTTANTHPFESATAAFAHNGSISPPGDLEAFLSPENRADLEGTTDSERYFRMVLSAAQTEDLADALVSTVEQIADTMSYTSLNALMLTPESLYAVCFYSAASLPTDLPEDYYEMRYRQSSDAVMVASSGWKNDDWSPLANGTLMVIDRSTGQTSFTSLRKKEASHD